MNDILKPVMSAIKEGDGKCIGLAHDLVHFPPQYIAVYCEIPSEIYWPGL